MNNDKDDEDNEDNEDDEGNLEDQVKRFVDDAENDAENGPDWMFDEDEKTSPDPDYTFCPAAHRKGILHLFTKHFCQHLIFPERHSQGIMQTSQEIRENTVYEMYHFCHARGLREVWGYMWENWYCPKMWKLWARSTSPYLSRLRTTMGVENFWRQLKYNHLHLVACPRLDHLVWILIYKVTPAYFAHTGILDDSYRLGRSKTLTTYQRAFKKAWRKLAAKPISGKHYETSIKEWKCDCGQQKYQCHHLCKHLI